jgi:hypothetical protein
MLPPTRSKHTHPGPGAQCDGEDWFAISAIPYFDYTTVHVYERHMELLPRPSELTLCVCGGGCQLPRWLRFRVGWLAGVCFAGGAVLASWLLAGAAPARGEAPGTTRG